MPIMSKLHGINSIDLWIRVEHICKESMLHILERLCLNIHIE